MRPILAVIVLLLSPKVNGAMPQFEFAGFNIRTTTEAVLGRFPESRVTDDYIYVSPEDPRDGIIGVVLDAHHVVLFFGMGRKCADVFERIETNYGEGGAHVVGQSLKNHPNEHWRVWKYESERLALRCLTQSGGRFAEKIEFYLEKEK